MKNYKSLILAAGLGTRMRPLTDSLPKPLLDFNGLPILEWIRRGLFNAGIKDVAVNIHHLPKVMDSYLDSSPAWKNAFRSYELPEILGSGGALSKISSWRLGSDLVAYNGDVVCDVDLKEVVAHHESAGAELTLVLTPKPFGRDRSVYLRGRHVTAITNELVSETGVTAHGYTGICIYTSSFLDRLPKSGNFSVIEYWNQAVSQSKVSGYVHQGFWSAIDSLDLYEEAKEEARRRNLFVLKN